MVEEEEEEEEEDDDDIFLTLFISHIAVHSAFLKIKFPFEINI
jgi:hypothetical protein